jgi:light-regulated signal transduction histidine kinase (bacteriophytochrome)
MDNAAKFSSGRAEPKIEIQGSVSEGNVVIMTIKDNGVGFDMQHSTGLFQVFKRLHAESEFEGTGIGLATVQRILEKHGGKIWTKAILGEGAEFFFSIPTKED